MRISDNREALAMSSEEADLLFQQIAELEIAATATAAQYEKELAAVKSRAAIAQSETDAIAKPLRERLNAYITTHPERFAKPRMRKTEFGSYGLRSATKLEITDEAAALMSVKAQGIHAYTIIERLDKKAIEKAISDGITVTGAEIRTGEIAKYEVARALIDRAKNKQD